MSLSSLISYASAFITNLNAGNTSPVAALETLVGHITAIEKHLADLAAAVSELKQGEVSKGLTDLVSDVAGAAEEAAPVVAAIDPALQPEAAALVAAAPQLIALLQSLTAPKAAS